MVTPVFRIVDYAQARAFYIDWLGFRIDWEDRDSEDDKKPAYLQVSRGDVVLHLSGHQRDGCFGAVARAEVRGLPSYHHRLLGKPQPPMRPTLAPAYWDERVLEMEVTDPFGNRLIFCEPGMLDGSYAS